MEDVHPSAAVFWGWHKGTWHMHVLSGDCASGEAPSVSHTGSQDPLAGS